MKNKLKPTDMLIGILFTIFFISLGLFITINFRLLYYFDINFLNIQEISGFDKETILLNYNALIDYCSPFFQGNLKFPSMALSSSALQHFQEVKEIFNIFLLSGLVSFIILVFIILYKRKKKDNSYLLVSSITVILVPAIVGVASAINFDKTFLLFHKIVFRNDYWLFDWNEDQVIRILPQSYFLHCAILIIILVLLGSLSLFLYNRKRFIRLP
jgi:integral membrane protein (TIGR01906 family)